MKRVAEFLVLLAIISGGVYLFYSKTNGIVRVAAIAILALSFVSSMAIFFIDKEPK
jgi:hypothetical protein